MKKKKSPKHFLRAHIPSVIATTLRPTLIVRIRLLRSVRNDFNDTLAMHCVMLLSSQTLQYAKTAFAYCNVHRGRTKLFETRVVLPQKYNWVNAVRYVRVYWPTPAHKQSFFSYASFHNRPRNVIAYNNAGLAQFCPKTFYGFVSTGRCAHVVHAYT
jgi:hypothetical protein